MATILVIEDDPDNQNLVRILLEQGGYQVVAASDGRKAWIRHYNTCPTWSAGSDHPRH